MPNVIILRGLPGSGKSTWAAQYLARHPRTARINRDTLREMLHGGAWSAGNESLIVRARDVLITQALMLGWSVVVDDTNLQDYHLVAIRTLASVFGAGVEIVTMDTPLEECIRRDALRPQPVGEVVIRQMAERWRP